MERLVDAAASAVHGLASVLRGDRRVAGAPSSELWVDEHYPLLELYTGDTLAPGQRRRGLGAEPMTRPPNSFRTDEGVIRLEPGESITTGWAARLV